MSATEGAERVCGANAGECGDAGAGKDGDDILACWATGRGAGADAEAKSAKSSSISWADELEKSPKESSPVAEKFPNSLSLIVSS